MSYIAMFFTLSIYISERAVENISCGVVTDAAEIMMIGIIISVMLVLGIAWTAWTHSKKYLDKDAERWMYRTETFCNVIFTVFLFLGNKRATPRADEIIELKRQLAVIIFMVGSITKFALSSIIIMCSPKE